MKRFITIILAVVILFSLTITAYAETEGSLTITTTVVSNPPTWYLSIPADIDIPYKQTSTKLGAVTITDINNPDEHDGYVDIYLNYENLKSENGINEIPISILGSFNFTPSPPSPAEYQTNSANTEQKWNSGEKFGYKCTYKYFPTHTSQALYEATTVAFNHSATISSSSACHPVNLTAEISASAWEHAKPGTYSTTLTFTTQYGGYGVDYGI